MLSVPSFDCEEVGGTGDAIFRKHRLLLSLRLGQAQFNSKFGKSEAGIDFDLKACDTPCGSQ